MSALPMGNPGEDVPDWDERHDGYSVGMSRTVTITGGDGKVHQFTSSPNWLIINSHRGEDGFQSFIHHGATGTIEVLEALHLVITESLKRERDLLVSRERRASGPPPD